MNRWKRAALAVLAFVLAAVATAYADDSRVVLHGPWASDSLNGGAQYTTDAVQVGGATAVHFFVRDSVPSTAYVDSLTTATIQLSHDGTNWLTIPSAGASTWAIHDTSGCMITGDVSASSLKPESNGGWRTLTLCSISAGSPSGAELAPGSAVIPIRYARFRGVTANRFASPSVTGDADMVGLRIRVAVVYGNGRDFRIPTP